ncbi:MAG: DUF3277 family protein [Gallionella sp.]|nr:DUF3277 family protein [Gallionella sp.]MDD4958386.1 DUF3277 family protein [Gallionella sp.]
MSTYSFMDVHASITGPGGTFSLGYGSGVAEEGITVTRAEKDTMTIGADGTPMHSLSANQSGELTIRFLKTAPTNQLLMALYDLQSASSALWGSNVVVITNTASGDIITCTNVAFRKAANTPYAIEGGMYEWEFNAGRIASVLGKYS